MPDSETWADESAYTPEQWMTCSACGWSFLRPENPVSWNFCPMCGKDWREPAIEYKITYT